MDIHRPPPDHRAFLDKTLPWLILCAFYPGPATRCSQCVDTGNVQGKSSWRAGTSVCVNEGLATPSLITAVSWRGYVGLACGETKPGQTQLACRNRREGLASIRSAPTKPVYDESLRVLPRGNEEGRMK
jgi:hypothetical protein